MYIYDYSLNYTSLRKKEGMWVFIVVLLLIIIPFSISYEGNSGNYDVVISDFGFLSNTNNSALTESVSVIMKQTPVINGSNVNTDVYLGLSRLLGPLTLSINMSPSMAYNVSIINCSGSYIFDLSMDNLTNYYKFSDTSGNVNTSWNTSGLLNCSQNSCVSNQNLTCHFMVDDGKLNSSIINETLNLFNQPIINWVNVTPLTAYTNQTFNCTANATDLEGDNLTYYYSFDNSTSVIQSWSQNNLLNCSSVIGCVKLQNISCNVKVDDGYVNSSIISSSSITVLNYIPIISNVSSNMSNLLLGSSINISSLGVYDLDNDTLRIECGNQTGSNNLCLGNYDYPEVSCSFNSTWVDTAYHNVFCKVYDLDNYSSETNLSIFSDNSAPIINLILPLNNNFTRSEYNITFFYNVTDDINISSCKLILNDTLGMENYSVIRNIEQNFTKGITKGDWSWWINCSDILGNEGMSQKRNITQNYSQELLIINNIGSTGYNNTNNDYTFSRNVVLTLDLFPTANLCRFKNEGSTYGEWELCPITKFWALNKNLGNQTVYLQVNHSSFDLGLITTIKDWVIFESSGAHLDVTSPNIFNVYNNGNFTNNSRCLSFFWDDAIDVESNILDLKINYSYSLIDLNQTVIIPWKDVGYEKILTCPLNNSEIIIDNNVIFLMHFNNDSRVLENESFVYDHSNNNNNGIVNGSTYNYSGKFSGAYIFDGINDFISLNDSTINLTSNFTFMAWIIINDNGSFKTIYDDGSISANYWSIMIDNSSLFYREDSGTNVWGSINIKPNVWHHVVVSKSVDSGNNLAMYVNGEQDVVSPVGSSISSGIKHIGVRKEGVSYLNYFNGSIDEVVIWNKSLTANEIKLLYLNGASDLNLIENHSYILNVSAKNSAGLITYSTSNNVTIDLTSPNMSWINSSHTSSFSNIQQILYNWSGTDSISNINGYSFLIDNVIDTIPDEITDEYISKSELILEEDMVLLMHFNNDSSAGENSSIVNDYSVNNYDGIINGSVFNQSGGIIDGAYKFDGVNDFITLPNNIFDKLEVGTISAWVYKTGSGFESFFSASGTNLFEMAIDNDGEFVVWISGVLFYAEVPIVNPTNKWHHLVYVVSPNGNEIFVDGVKQNPIYTQGSNLTSIFFDDINNSATKYELGRTVNYNPEAWTGYIDEFAIWNKSLSNSEITNLYNKGINVSSNLFSKTDGSYYFHIMPKDGAGNWGEPKHIGPIRIDTTPPSKPIPTNPTIYGTGNNISFSWSQSIDSFSGFDYYFVNITDLFDNSFSTANISSLNYNLNSVLGHNYNIMIRAYDVANNYISSEISSETPILILSITPNSSTINSDPIIVVTTDKKANCVENKSGNNFIYTNGKYHETKVIQSTGLHNLKVTCYDEVNFSVQKIISYTIDKSSSPIVNIGTLTNYYVGNQVRIPVDISNNLGGINVERFKVYLNNTLVEDFSVIDNDNKGNYTIYFNAKSSGIFNLNVTVDDNSDIVSNLNISELTLSISIGGISSPQSHSRLTYSSVNNDSVGVASDSNSVVVQTTASTLKLKSGMGRTFIFITKNNFNAKTKNNIMVSKKFDETDNTFGYKNNEDKISHIVNYKNMLIEGVNELQSGSHSIFLKNLGINSNNKTVLKVELE